MAYVYILKKGISIHVLFSWKIGWIYKFLPQIGESPWIDAWLLPTRSWSSELLNGTKLKCLVSLGCRNRNGQVKAGHETSDQCFQTGLGKGKKPKKNPLDFFLRLAKTEALYLFQGIRAGIPVSPSGGDWWREKNMDEFGDGDVFWNTTPRGSGGGGGGGGS